MDGSERFMGYSSKIVRKRLIKSTDGGDRGGN